MTGAFNARTLPRFARYAFFVCSLTVAGLGPGVLFARDYDHGGHRSGGPIVNTVDGPVRGPR